MNKISKSVRLYMSKLGQKGGQTTGDSKRRDPEKMRAAVKKRWDMARRNGKIKPFS